MSKRCHRPQGRWDHDLGEYLPSLSATDLARPYGRRFDRVDTWALAWARAEGEVEHAAFDHKASRFQRR
jgi:hypothetical protein